MSSARRRPTSRLPAAPAVESLDLNLLRVFDALRIEGSVSGAARRLLITQPGASRALARLRDAFDDPLFLPAQGRLLLTPYAERIAGYVRDALELLSAGIARPDFDPQQSERRFAVSMPDYGEALLLPPLCRRLSGEAPGVRIEVVGSTVSDPRGGGDLGIAPYAPASPRMQIRRLLRDEYAAVARAGHPVFGLEALLSADDARLAHFPAAPDSFPSQLGGQLISWPGTQKAPPVESQNYFASVLLLAQTDWIAMLPRLLALQLVKSVALRILPIRIDLGGFDLYMHWHERFQADAGHRWLRNVLREVASALEAS